MEEKQQQSITVSVIIPVYNTEKYLRQCVDSVLTQTYKNIEVILVDDGSTDNSGRICDDYAMKDSRIVVIHKENGGSSDARNTGLKEATGDFVMFVDSDDWIACETVDLCVCSVADEVECVLFPYIREYGQRSANNPFLCFSYDAPTIVRRLIGPIGKELRRPLTLDNYSTCWGKLYRIDTARRGKIVNEKEVGSSEDTIFNLYALGDCQKIAFLNECLYHYRKVSGETLTSKYREGLADKWEKQFAYFERFIERKEKGKEDYWQALTNRVACGTVGLFMNEINAETSFWKKSAAIRSILKWERYMKAFQNFDYSACSIPWRIYFLLCRYRISGLLAMILQGASRMKRRW